MSDSAGDQTQNLWFCRPAPYPLGHGVLDTTVVMETNIIMQPWHQARESNPERLCNGDSRRWEGFCGKRGGKLFLATTRASPLGPASGVCRN